MSKASKLQLAHLMLGWEKHFIRYPWIVILLFIASAGLTLRYTIDHLKVNTNTADMISLDLPFQKNRLALEKAFPQDIGTALLLVEGPTPETTSQAVNRIAQLARQDTHHFSHVFVPDEGDFFARNGLLYLSSDDLEKLTGQLANAQPFIGRLAEDNSLRGLLGIVGKALNEGQKEDIRLELDPLLTRISEALNAAAHNIPYEVSWRQLMTPDAGGFGVTKRMILIKPVLDYSEVMPAGKAIEAINDIIHSTIRGELAHVSVRRTGEVILEHEEMETISSGVSSAGLASLILVCLTLWLAYRSVKLMFATFVSLTLGLIFSLGFATVAIGQLNLISIGFAVLFIGMGDAYSSHFCLRYRELLLEGHSQRSALQITMTSTGPALVLSAITAAIGLFAFIPTSYSGVAELGIIAGASMFIALATTFTILPALMKIMPIHPVKADPDGQPEKRGTNSNWPLYYARSIRWITIFLAIGAAILTLRVQIDFNPVNLRDPNTESVKTFKYLLQSKDTTPMTLSSLASSEEDMIRLAGKYRALPTVDRVVTLLDLIPDNQDEKLEMISDLSVMMGSQLNHFPVPDRSGATREVINDFHQTVRQALTSDNPSSALAPLDQALTAFEARLAEDNPEARQTLLDHLQSSLLDPLPSVIHDLSQSLNPQPITRESLPKDLVERWVSPDGLYRLQISPKKDLNDLENLREFILDAQCIDPDVTDLPVTYLESMNEVIKAFQQAFAIAFLAITLIILLVLRSIRDTLLVLLPLILASLFTAAATVLLHIPFNFANIIALPLLFGLGVDSGIHMAHRLHEIERQGGSLLGTSEAKGVFYGALTTVFSFSSLALTSHQGTASMGLLLSIGLMLTLFCALVVLPAFSGVKARAHD